MRNDIRPKRRPSAPRPASHRPASRPVTPVQPPAIPAEIRIGPEDAASVRSPRRLPKIAVIALAGLAIAGLGVRANAGAEQAKSQVVSAVTVAKDAFAGAKASLKKGDYHAAADQFGIARQSLHRANQALARNGQLVGMTGSQASGEISSGLELLQSAELVAESGQRLTSDADGVQTDLAGKGNDLYKSGEVLVGRLPAIRSDLDDANRRVELFADTVASANATGSLGPYGRQLAPIAASLPELKSGLADAKQVADALPALLGTDRFKQYLILFENPAELRPTGGFVGTYGRLTMDSGAVKELLVDSIYNPANQANLVIKDPAPEPFQRFAGSGEKAIWGMQNANYSPDFPTSVKQFQKSYERAGGPTTDGAIAITVNPVVKILGIVGPIEMPDYNYTLDSSNFQQLIQSDQADRSQTGDTDPKRILRDFAPRLLAKIGKASPDQRQAIAKVIGDAVQSRDIMVEFRDPDLEPLATMLGADGTLPNEPYQLAPVDVNVAGLKSSIDIETTYDQKLAIADDGTVTGEITVTRSHTARTSDATNHNYTRLFLPKGSTLTGSAGWTDDSKPSAADEDGHTVISGWTDVDPGQTKTFTVRYRLPGRLSLTGSQLPLSFWKQGGISPVYHVSVTLPPGYAWQDGQGQVTGQTITLAKTIDSDFNQTLRFRQR